MSGHEDGWREVKASIHAVEIALAIMVASLQEEQKTAILAELSLARNTVEKIATEGHDEAAIRVALAWDRLLGIIHSHS